jgi:hypothetical protein
VSAVDGVAPSTGIGHAWFWWEAVSWRLPGPGGPALVTCGHRHDSAEDAARCARDRGWAHVRRCGIYQSQVVDARMTT